MWKINNPHYTVSPTSISAKCTEVQFSNYFLDPSQPTRILLCLCGFDNLWKEASCLQTGLNTDEDKQYHEARAKSEVYSSKEIRDCEYAEINRILKIRSFLTDVLTWEAHQRTQWKWPVLIVLSPKQKAIWETDTRQAPICNDISRKNSTSDEDSCHLELYGMRTSVEPAQGTPCTRETLQVGRLAINVISESFHPVS